MKDNCVIDGLLKINGIKYALLFDNVLVIDYDKGIISTEDLTKDIKKFVHEQGFNMITTKTTSSKKFMTLIKIKDENR